MNRYLAGVLALFAALLVVACSPRTPPEAAVDAALEYMRNSLSGYLQRNADGEPYLERFELVRAAPLEVSPTSEAGGIKEQWCFDVDYQLSFTEENREIDVYSVYIMTLRDAGWLVQRSRDKGSTIFRSLNREIAWWRCLQK